jgi:phosphatidylglycerol lysyltransferase
MFKPRFPLWNSISSNTKFIRVIVAASVALMGVINGFVVLQPIRISRLALLFRFLDQFAPFTPSLWPVAQIGRTLALLLGFFLCFVALGLSRGKRSAWQSAVILLPLSAFAHLIKGLDFEVSIFVMVLWLFVLMSKPHFSVKSDPVSVRQGVFLLLIGFSLLLVSARRNIYNKLRSRDCI